MVFGLIAVVAAILGILVLIIALARKGGNSTSEPAAVKQEPVPEQKKALDEAHSRLVNIRMTISRIQDSELSKAGVSACSAIDRVLSTLKDKPEKISDCRQLFNYYLPTMEKVVDRYQRMEAGKVENEKIPEKLKQYFQDVTQAMDNLYDGLYDSDKLNMAVDMEAMTIAIKRDGLLEEEDLLVQQSEGDF